MKHAKKLLALLLTLALTLSLCTGLVQAENPEMTIQSSSGPTWFYLSSDPHYWISPLDDGTVAIQLDSDYLSTLPSITIPAKIDGMRVTMITSDCFWGGENLTSITLPEGISTIEGRAFDPCTSLKSITIPASVTEIGGPFAQNMDSIRVAPGSKSFCTVDDVLFSKDMKTLVSYPLKKGGTSYQVPNGVENIHEYAFYGSDLTQITLPSGVRTIGEGAFSICPIEAISLPDGLRSIGSEAFEYCYSLRQITIPDSVETIGTDVFLCCENLQSAKLSNRLTVLPSRTFWGCSFLEHITIPDSVTSIGESAFAYCGSLQDFTIPDSVTYIAESAFERCHTLHNITIPESITGLGVNAFRDCSDLTVRIPSTLTNMSPYALGGVYSIVVDENNPALCSVDGVIFSKDMKTLLQYTAASNTTSYVIPDGVTEIGPGAFYEAYLPDGLVIPDSVTKLGEEAFVGSTLTKLTLPKGITEIPKAAFQSAYLQDLTITGEVTTIGDYAFGGSTLSSIDLPDTVTTIGTYAFAQCQNLERVHLPESLPRIRYGTFNNCEKLTEINFPFGLSEINAYAFTNCKKLSNVSLPATVTYIEIGAFSDCESIKTINYGGTSQSWSHIIIDEEENDAVKNASLQCSGIAHSDDQFYFVEQPGINELCLYALSDKARSRSSLTVPATFDGIPVGYIGANVFSGCSSLKNVTLSEGIKSIGNQAFSNCSDLQSVSLPDSVTSILDWAFMNCNNLQNITLSPRMIELGYGVFCECQSLPRICIPEGITEIASETFNDCYSLSEVVFPKTLKTIAYAAFSGCESLTKLELSEGLTYIGEYAFSYCYCLTGIRLPESLKELGDNAFKYCDALRWAYLPADLRSIGVDVFNNDGVFRDLYYGGTEAQWNGICEYPVYSPEYQTTIHYNSVPAVGDFLDVRESDWFCDSVAYAYEKGLMNGTGECIFSPQGSLTRAQLVTILYRVAGEPEVSFKGTFSDVAAGKWFSDAVEWAAAEGIVNGYNDGTFKPNDPITREQIATILYRAEGSPATSGSLDFPDAGKVSNYAKDAMRWAVGEGLINGIKSGSVTNLAPKNTATRAQIAAIIMRYLEAKA